MRETTFDLGFENPELEGLRVLICNRRVSSNGDLESAFLDGAVDLHRHAPGRTVAEALRIAASRANADTIAVIRNPDLVLDADLQTRLSQAMEKLADSGPWAIASAGGLGLCERRHLALYASLNPAIPLPGGPQPILDPMPDMYLANAGFLRAALAGNTLPDDDALETALAVQGYLDGRLSVFLPRLWAGINGSLMSRDIVRQDRSLSERFGVKLPGQTIQTLSGPVSLDAPTDNSSPFAPNLDLEQRINALVTASARPPSISIVTRTRFDRPHLLDRLLTSIARARSDDIAIEVVLSTDVPEALAHQKVEELRHKHTATPLALAVNASSIQPSRVANLIGGLRATNNDYIVVVDDDDYLDLFAFENLLPAFFQGNRPIIFTASEVHAETWDLPANGPGVVSRSESLRTYPATGWLGMFGGVNALPVCAAIMPRDFVLRRLDALDLTNDLSEDYALFLLLLTAPDLPTVHEMAEPFCHISLRGSENSVTMPDRRPWVRDIVGHLGHMTSSPKVAGAGVWALLAAGRGEEATQTPMIADLRRSLTHRDADIRLLRRENARLRAEIVQNLEATS